MNFVIGLILLFLLLTAIKQFARMDAAAAARLVRHGGGVLGMLGALLLLLRGRVGLAAALAGMVASFAGWRTPGAAWSAVSQRRRRARRPGRVSTARSAMIEMRLDHDSGVMSGTVLAGAYAGRALETLSRPELLALREELARDDPDGVSLLEAYLDRRFAGWREADEGQRQGRGKRRRDVAPGGARGSGSAGGRERGGHHSRPSSLDEEVSSRSWRLDRACRAGQSGQGCSDAATRLGEAPERRTAQESSVAGGEAGKSVAFEGAAGGFGGSRIEPREARAVERVVALAHLLGDRLGRGEGRAVPFAGAGQKGVRLGGSSVAPIWIIQLRRAEGAVIALVLPGSARRTALVLGRARAVQRAA